MKKPLFVITLCGLMAAGLPAFAESPDVETMNKLNKMTPEQRDAFHKERQDKWNAMSKEEKLKAIEDRRKEHRQKMDDKWNRMSDDEKIKHVEGRMGRSGPGGSELKGPPPHVIAE